jgi:hypothetical protein
VALVSLVALSWAWDQEGLDPIEKFVLVAISDAHNESNGRCFPSVKTIARRTGASERTVQRYIGQLERRALIARVANFGEDGRQRSNEYRLAVDAQIQIPIQSGEGDSLSPRGVVHDPGEGDTRDTLPGDSGVTPLKRTGRNEPEEVTIGDAGAPRPRDLLWDALVERFGPVAERTNAHAKRNKAVADLKRLGADVDGIALALAAWPRVFPQTTVTDQALATHYPQLVHASPESDERFSRLIGSRQVRPPCPECGVGAGKHAADCTNAPAPAQALREASA